MRSWWCRAAFIGRGRFMPASRPSRAASPERPGTDLASSACAERRRFPLRTNPRSHQPARTRAPFYAGRCGYTRKSTEHNLDLAFNSLDAQREACEAYVKSQAHEGWMLVPGHFDDGGVSGASL